MASGLPRFWVTIVESGQAFGLLLRKQEDASLSRMALPLM